MKRVIVVCASFINGFLTGPMWLAMSKLVGDCSTKDNSGFFFSLFFVFYISSMIFSALISAAVFKNL
jgi:hypothetical protein